MEPGQTNFEEVKARLRSRATRYFRALAFEAYRRIVFRTPVLTGRARANWMFTADAPSDEVRDTVDPTGGTTVAEGATQAQALELGQPAFIVNNLPYIGVLEHGGYPDPVKRGTWMGPGRGYEIRSAGGFSKQAPAGMVAVTLAEIRQLAQEHARILGGAEAGGE